MENEDVFILRSQNRDYWCSGDTRNQDISNHGINLVLIKRYGFRTRRVKGLLDMYGWFWKPQPVITHVSYLQKSIG